jgi:hypothetical protein
MLNIKSNTIVYVLCPSYIKSGGPELAHQLVKQINDFHGHAEIAYYDIENNGMKINEAFKCYVQSFVEAKKIIDEPQNVVVVPETHPEFLNWYKNVQKCIWWMSVDNYYRDHKFFKSLAVFGYNGVRRIINTILSEIMGNTNINNKVLHLYQSEYAKDFLIKKGIKNTKHLSDYLNSSYLNLEIDTVRQDQVLYNPVKGFKITRKLMEIAPDIKWVPLQGMTTEQVKETLLQSKVYIDFGNHPGKDRFPREAAMCGCCVITGKRGSANFAEDVPVLDEFKFDESKEALTLIIAKIRNCLEDYASQVPKFDHYRNFIKDEFRVFQSDVKAIFLQKEQDCQPS